MQKEQDEHEYIIKMIQAQILRIQNKMTELGEKISKMEGACAERHKCSLDAQLQKLQARETFEEQNEKRIQKKLEELEKTINAHKLEAEQRFNGIQEAMKDRCKSVQEDNNQFRTRITILEQQKSSREEQRITIKTQVIIGVLVALLTSIITSAVAYFGNFHIVLDNGNNHPQTVQTIEINEQGQNK